MSNTMREAAAMLGKMGAFLDTMARAKVVLEAAALAEQQESAAADRVKAAEAVAATAEANAAASVKAAQKAAQAVTDANALAESVVLAAHGKASELVAAATAHAAEIKRDADVDRATAEATLSNARSVDREIALRVKQAGEELADITRRIADAKAEALARFGS